MKLSIGKIILIILVGLILLSGFFYFYYQMAVGRKNYDGQGQAEFIITPGQRVYEIAENLKKDHLINSASAFKIYVKLNNLGAKLQAGYYHLPRNLSIKELVDILQHGKFDLKLTFPEGWRREEMAYNAAKQLGRESFYADFMNESKGLEGFLLPETYIVPRDVTAKELVRVMRETFDRKYSEIFRSLGPHKSFTKEEIIILASVIEREAKRDEDRPVIAGIFIKRLKNGWPLEADATVQYALASRVLPSLSFSKLTNFDFWPKEITLEGLKYDSAYNTRLHKGLPAAPICNPGALSIEAVFKAVETPYWYYLTGSDGVTRYASTLDEHNRNIGLYLRP